MNSRRKFLKLLGIGAAAVPVLPSIIEAAPAAPVEPFVTGDALEYSVVNAAKEVNRDIQKKLISRGVI